MRRIQTSRFTRLHRLSRGGVAFLYISFVILSSLTFLATSPEKAAAYVDNDGLSIADQQSRTKLYALGNCLTRGGLKETVTGEELNKHDIYYPISGGWNGDIEVAVGHEIQPDDGTVACKNINHDQALGFVGKTYLQYTDALYQQEGSSASWKLRDNAQSNMDRELIAARSAKRQSEGSAVGPKEFKRRIAVALARCLENVPEGKRPERETVQLGGTTYQYRDGMGSKDRISTGHDLDSHGGYECRQLVDYAKPGGVGELTLPQGVTLNDVHDNPQVLANIANGQDPGAAVAAPGKDGQNGPTCESEGGALAWILCSVISVLDSGINKLDDKISSLLKVQESDLRKPEMLDAAKRIRNVAYIILVPIMLVMVIGTALGFEFISAYTVKRALPRLVAATIFIALSYQIATFMVAFVNTLGSGIAGLILQPLVGNGDTTLTSILSPAAAGQLGGGVLFAGIVAGIAIGPAIIGILLSYAFVAFVVMLIGFAILAIRQVLLLVLALLAPLAILSWIFPNNDKLWKIWWGTFTKLLLMYPLIELLVAAGKVFASFSFASQPQPFGALLAVTAYIVPYFFIPATFKWAGGAFAALSGIVNNRSKGLFDRQRAFRQKTGGEAWRDFKTGGVSSGGLGLRGAASRGIGRRVGVGWKGQFGLGSQERFRQATDQMGRQAGVENVMKGPGWNGIANNDDALMAATYASGAAARAGLVSRFGDTEAGRARADRAIAAAQSSIGFGRPQAIAAAQQLVSTGTGYNDMHDMVQTIARAGGGNRNTMSAIAGFANSETKKVGRNDLAPGFGLLDRAVRAEAGAQFVGADEAADLPAPDVLMDEAWNSGGLYAHANSKPRSLENLLNHLDTRHVEALASGDRGAIVQAETSRLELREMLKNSTGSNAQLINNTLETMDARAPALPDVETEARRRARVFDTQARGTDPRRDT